MTSEPTYTSKGVSIVDSSTLDSLTYSNEIIVLTLVCIILLGVTMVTDRTRLKQTFETILGDRWINQNLKDKFSFNNRNSLLLLVCYSFCFALISLSANAIWNFVAIDPIVFVGLAAVSIFVLFWVKRSVLYLTAWSIGYQNEIGDYLFNHSVYTITSGIILLPFVILLNFTKFSSPTILKSTLLFLLLFMLLRLVKTISLSIKNNIGSLFYIILYICTLEILPLVVFYKALVSKIA